VYQNPRVTPEDLAICYSGEYYTHTPPVENLEASLPLPSSLRGRIRRAILHAAYEAPAGDEDRLIKLFGAGLARFPGMRRRARFGLPEALAKRGASSGACLEVGPGQGVALAQLRRLGWQAVGLDVDPVAAQTARKLSGCDVRVGTLVDCDFRADSFDLIYMGHVVEHLPNLQPSLERCLELLRPRGRLVLVYPNPESLGAKWYPEHITHWDPPYHLVLPSKQGMCDLLRRIGFERLEVSTPAHQAALLRAVAFQLAKGTYRHGARIRARAGDLVFKGLESILTLLGFPVGEEILIVARKGD
jgi:SAM-dependent methyltransferase